MSVRYEDPFMLVCSLEPRALKILVVMLLARRKGMAAPIEKDLQTWSGESQNTVRRAIGRLELFGLITKHKGQKGWFLTDDAVQLPLMALLTDEKESKNDSFFDEPLGAPDEKESKNDSFSEDAQPPAEKQGCQVIEGKARDPKKE